MRYRRSLAVHAGNPAEGIALVPPIYRSSTYLFEDPEDFDAIRYTRLNNTPSQACVERTLAALHHCDIHEGLSSRRDASPEHAGPNTTNKVERGPEQAIETLLTPSGTAAVWLGIASCVQRGDHMLAPTRIYGGTRKLLALLQAREGIDLTYVPIEAPETWRDALRPNTKAFYFEPMTNPWIEVPPLDALRDFCKAHGLTSIVDNTVLTPALFRPLHFGFDVVVESASKALNGHTDVVAGVVSAAPSRVHTARMLANRFGVCPDPQMCALLSRGLKTLFVRTEAQGKSAAQLAAFFAEHPAVAKVYHPSLPSHQGHARSQQWFDGHGALLSVTLHGGDEAVQAMIHALQIPVEAPSFGGAESLISRPSLTSQGGLSDAVKALMGIPDGMLRVSVGLEDIRDLRDDFSRALDEAGRCA